MALFGKKKKKEETVVEAEVKQENSTLDMIKEAMEEAKEERAAQMTRETEEAAAAQRAAAETDREAEQMPSPEEIRKAQEVLARAQKAHARTVAANAPINTANLRACIMKFMSDKSQDNLKLVMDCLQKAETHVTVPAQIITSPENQEKMKKGGQVKLEGPVHINPVILTDNNGVKVFPIFSGEDAIPDNLKNKTPKVNMPLVHCLNIMKNIKDVNTIALDPYTANIRINVNVEQKKKS